MITLSRTEFVRFAEYLEQEVISTDLLIEQLKKLGPSHSMIVEKLRAEASAARVVVKRLRSIEIG